MSLHQLANHLQSAGRGEDKVLVHMTPGEVKGLQSLAMSQGGSLTINPETGLPEAGILSSLLPIVAGAFLGPAGLGLTAMQTGLAVGALGTAATGSLGKGLMMGFGAYGGAGLGEGLMNAGASSMPNAGAGAANAQGAAAVNNASSSYSGLDKIAPTTTTATTTGASTTGNAAVTSGGLPAYQAQGYNNIFSNPNVTAYGGTASVAPAPFKASEVLSKGFVNPPPVTAPAAPVAPVTPVAPSAIAKPDVFAGGNVSINAPIQTALAPPPVAPTPPPVTAPAAPVSNFDKVGAGLRDVTSSGTKAWNFVKEHPTPFIGLGVGALQEMQEQKAKNAAAAAGSGSPGMIRPYEYSVAQNQSAYAPSASTAERKYFVEPRYTAGTPYAAKEGGVMGLKEYAVGGPVEQMSAQNAISGNEMYPQSQLQTPMYSNPMMSRPMPTNVIQSGLDAPVGAYSGEAKFAPGGLTMGAGKSKEPSSEVKYSFDPATQQYTQSTTTTPAAQGGNGVNMPMPGYGYTGMMGLNLNFKPQQAPQPTTTTEVSGGITAPMMQAQPQTQPQYPTAPNINIPPQQSVNQQLGLEAFYPMMEQQLAMKGSQLQSQNMADGGMAGGGYNLGGYSDGGRLLRGPGDGVSDSIPASIGNRQPARLADGEFVVPARIVSEIGNGSTEAGARKLYAMMDRVQKARGKTTGKNKVAVNTKAEKLLPA